MPHSSLKILDSDVVRAPAATPSPYSHPAHVPAKRVRLSKSRIRRALIEAHGVKAQAARDLGCAYMTIKEYCKRYPELQELVGAIKEKILDEAELQLYEAVKQGDPEMVRFAIKQAGKSRGYGETQEVTGSGGGPVTVSFALATGSDDYRPPADHPAFAHPANQIPSDTPEKLDAIDAGVPNQQRALPATTPDHGGGEPVPERGGGEA